MHMKMPKDKQVACARVHRAGSPLQAFVKTAACIYRLVCADQQENHSTSSCCPVSQQITTRQTLAHHNEAGGEAGNPGAGAWVQGQRRGGDLERGSADPCHLGDQPQVHVHAQPCAGGNTL